MARGRGRGRTVSIRFKDNKVSKVSGARNLEEAASAALFGQMFVDELTGPERVATTLPRGQPLPPAPPTRTDEDE